MTELRKYEFKVQMLFKFTHVDSFSARTPGPAAVCRVVARQNRRLALCLIFHLVVLADRYTDTVGKGLKNEMCHDLPEN